jgi:hypothetical protein
MRNPTGHPRDPDGLHDDKAKLLDVELPYAFALESA